MHPQAFHSFEDAETAIKDQVLSLCNDYTTAIKALLPVLKKGADALTGDDQTLFSQLHQEGSDHLHNLTQLVLELEKIQTNTRETLLEISAEVLALSVQYLDETPKKISQTQFFKSS